MKTDAERRKIIQKGLQMEKLLCYAHSLEMLNPLSKYFNPFTKGIRLSIKKNFKQLKMKTIFLGLAFVSTIAKKP